MPIAKEVRIFCIYHESFATIEYWTGEGEELTSEYEDLIMRCKHLNSNFYAIDLAQKADNSWIVMEVGDGQVSGLQEYDSTKFLQSIDEETRLITLFRCINILFK